MCKINCNISFMQIIYGISNKLEKLSRRGVKRKAVMRERGAIMLC